MPLRFSRYHRVFQTIYSPPNGSLWTLSFFQIHLGTPDFLASCSEFFARANHLHCSVAIGRRRHELQPATTSVDSPPPTPSHLTARRRRICAAAAELGHGRRLANFFNLLPQFTRFSHEKCTIFIRFEMHQSNSSRNRAKLGVNS